MLALVALVAFGCRRPRPSPDTLTVLTLADPEHLDPRFPEDALGAALGRLVYRGLVETDPTTFLTRPALAERLEYTDATHLRVTLRDDARFQDGSPITAHDVAATYQALLNPSLGSRLRSTYARVLDRVEALDERTAVFTLKRPDGTLESLLQQPILRASDALRAELRATPGAERDFIGSGALRVASLQQGAWTFRRAARENGAPDTIRVLSLHDPNTLAQRLLHGDGDVAEIKPELFSVFAARRDFTVASAPSAGFTYLGLHCESRYLRDARVRTALAHAIDRERLRQGKLGRFGVAATGPLPPTHWAYAADVARYPFDPPRARALLDEAGWTDPPGPAPRMRLVLRVASQRFALAVAHALSAMLMDVGVEIEIRPSELATLLADLRAGRFDMAFLTVPDLSDPWGLAFWFASSSIPTPANPGAGGNRWRFRDTSLDAALEAGARAIGPDARRPHYQIAQRILAEQLPVIPMWHADVVFVASRRFRGLVPRGDGQLDFLLRLVRAR